MFARIVTQNMVEQWNGAIVNEIKSGANGSIAAEEVGRSAPDRLHVAFGDKLLRRKSVALF